MSEVSLSREVNGRIRRVAAGDPVGSSRATYHFLCVCGCLGLVGMSPDRYDACAGNVFKDGHRMEGPRAAATIAH